MVTHLICLFSAAKYIMPYLKLRNVTPYLVKSKAKANKFSVAFLNEFR